MKFDIFQFLFLLAGEVHVLKIEIVHYVLCEMMLAGFGFSFSIGAEKIHIFNPYELYIRINWLQPT